MQMQMQREQFANKVCMTNGREGGNSNNERLIRLSASKAKADVCLDCPVLGLKDSSLICLQYCLPICLSPSVFPLNQQKRTIGEEL